MFLILTVGTGTAGLHSNLASGLVNSVRSMSVPPNRILLVPSSSEDSLAIAEIVAEEFPGVAEVAEAHLRIDEPDDLLNARLRIRSCIEELSGDMQAGEELVLNPTSGTKQMTLGAFLAAAENPGVSVTFIGGPRQDGVVVTGKEQNLFFEANLLHRERALRHARTLNDSGSSAAAALLLEPFGDTTRETREASQCLAAWQALRHEDARQIAARSSHVGLVPLRGYLQELRDSGPASVSFVSDVFASALRLEKWARGEDALVRLYQTVEFAGRARLSERWDLREPYDEEAVLAAPGWLPEQARKLRSNARSGKLHLGLRQVYELLHALGDEQSSAPYLQDASIQGLLSGRNEYVHSGKAPPLSQIRKLAQKTEKLALTLLPELDFEKPTRFWTSVFSS